MLAGVDICSAVNFSEGRRQTVIDHIAAAAARSCHVADLSSDADHNRTVITLAGSAGALVEGILRAAAEAVELIDLTSHEGAHPRLGAVDVVPFTPLDATMAQAVDSAVESAGRLWNELNIPCFLYEQAARTPEAKSLPWLRRNAFKQVFPDFGGSEPHPTAGAAVVGARALLVAFNVNLDTADLFLARSIASQIRGGEHAVPGIRSLGLMMTGSGYAQVSVNITNTDQTTMWDVFSAVDSLAREHGTAASGSELIGLAPRHSLGVSDLTRLKLRQEPKILEEVLPD